MSKYQEDAKKVIATAEQSLRTLIAAAAQEGDYDSVGSLMDASRRLLVLFDVPATPDETENSQEGETSLDPADRFFREGNNLLLKATSSRNGGAYEHRMGRDDVESVISSIVKATRKDVVFKVKNLLPILDPSDKTKELPQYKSQLVIRWLLASDLVTRHGHRGYSCRDRGALAEAVDRLWSDLPNAI